MNIIFIVAVLCGSVLEPLDFFIGNKKPLSFSMRWGICQSVHISLHDGYTGWIVL